jgi:hypothetical protein
LTAVAHALEGSEIGEGAIIVSSSGCSGSS